MSEYRRIVLLVLTMSVVVSIATAAAIGILYKTAFERQRLQLVDSAQTHALLLDALARFDRQYLHDYPGEPEAATLAQIRDAFESEHAVGGTTEITLGQRRGDSIVFLMRHRHARSGTPEPVPYESSLAEPMRQALAGRSGSMVGLDYHGEMVLAAYEPVATLSLGVVAKIDLAEIRAPFHRAGAIVLAIALVLILAGSLLFIRLTNPMLRKLRDREAQLDLILGSTGEGIFGMDLEGRCIFANRAALAMLGYAGRDELLGRDIHELIHHTHPDGSPHLRSECPTSRAIAAGKALRVDDEMLWRADGSGFPAEYRTYPMHSDGRVVGAVVSFVDISERRQKELELLHAQKMEIVGRLTGGIAHDFNNLLTIILGNLRLLRREKTAVEDSEATELIDDALSAAEDGAALTHGLLAFSRKQTLHPEPIDVNEFLRDNTRFLRRITGGKIRLRTRLDPDPLVIYADPQQLQSALLNLTVNACDAMPDGGSITIRTRGEPPGAGAAGLAGRRALITVADEGVGMEREVADRAIEPFFTTKPPGKGSGLGLSMVYGFAKQSGGDLDIRSTTDVGTEVTLSLPAAEPEAGSASPRGSVREALAESPARVLIVEDEPRLRRFTARALAADGHRIVEAGNAEEARRILADDDGIDLLLSDIVMPGDMDGRSLASWARQHRPGLRILLTTGHSHELPGPGPEPFRVLRKPYSVEQLRAVVDALMGRRAA